MSAALEHGYLDSNGQRIAFKRYTSQRNQDKPGLLFLGGFKSSMAGTKANFLIDLAQKKDISCVVFDYFGHGKSTGAFEEGTITLWLENARTVLEQLTQGPQIMIGSSMGGWLMLLLGQLFPKRLHHLIGIASSPGFTERLYHQRLSPSERARLQDNSVVDVVLGGDAYVISHKLIEDGKKHLIEAPKTYACTIDLLHGTADNIAPWRISQELLSLLRCPKVSLHLLKEGDHKLTRKDELEFLEQLILNARAKKAEQITFA